MTRTCAVPGCSFDARGTAAGAPEPRCSGPDCPPGGVLAWLSADPEDLEPYEEYARVAGLTASA